MLPPNALNALLAATFGGVSGVIGVVLVGGLPKNPVEVKDEVPKEEAPNFGAPTEESSVLGIVAGAAPTDLKIDVDVLEVAPGFWEKGEEEGVVLLAPNALKPGWRLLKPALDVFRLPNAPPPAEVADGVVVDTGAVVAGVVVSVVV